MKTDNIFLKKLAEIKNELANVEKDASFGKTPDDLLAQRIANSMQLAYLHMFSKKKC